MVNFPAYFLDHLDGLPGYDKEGLLFAHQQSPPTSIRYNPYKKGVSFPKETSISWSRNGYYLAERPSFTFDPLFHAGAYYVQEASSQLLEAFVLQLLDTSKALRVLDLCAAPGGKSTHLLSLIGQDSLLVSNEVIRSRTGILADNLDKWGCHNVVVTQADPAELGALTGFFDLVVVDAPCSGSGLFRKDPEAMSHWSLSAVSHCAARQKRIISDIWPALREGGIMIYSTCSFSKEEDEQMVSQILGQSDSTLLQIDCPAEWGVTAVELGYRCWPHHTGGEGFFISAIRKDVNTHEHLPRSNKSLQRLTNQQRSELSGWWEQDPDHLFYYKDHCHAFPANRLNELAAIFSICEPIRVGTRLGGWSRTDWIPDHALALSWHAASSIPRIQLDLPESIRYLQRGVVERAGLSRGWYAVGYQELLLGWVKCVGNRINNYYPSHLRILKQSTSKTTL